MNTTVQSISDTLFGKNFKYAKEVLIALLIGIVGVASYFGYRWYGIHKEESAQILFSHNVEEFERVMQEGKKDDWANVETLFRLGYEQYSSTALAPFFLVYQSQAMLKQEKYKEAFELFEHAINIMNASAPMTPLYKTSLALMRLDAQDEAMKNLGIKELQDLASDEKNIAFDIASYYLGLYFISNNEESKAQEVWQKLVESQKDVAKMGKSPWAVLAQQKLGLQPTAE